MTIRTILNYSATVATAIILSASLAQATSSTTLGGQSARAGTANQYDMMPSMGRDTRTMGQNSRSRDWRMANGYGRADVNRRQSEMDWQPEYDMQREYDMQPQREFDRAARPDRQR